MTDLLANHSIDPQHDGLGNNTTTSIGTTDLPIVFQPLRSDRVLVAFTVAYVLIFLVGLVGNLLTCLVVLRRHYVHSQTPFYLNLAFSDLILLAVGLPIDVWFFWFPNRPLGGTWFCIFRAMVTESATNASILTIVVFTAERWISICHPSKSATNNFPNSSTMMMNGWRFGQGKNGKYVLMLLWVTAVLAALPLSAQVGLVPINEDGSAGVCHIVEERAVPYSFEVSSVTFFVVPMILITLFYSSIIVQLRRTVARQSSVNDSPLMHMAGKARQQAKASGAVVKILIAVVVAFFICFLPHHLQRLTANYVSAQGDARWVSFSQLLFTISGLFYYISTTVNPVIYCLLSKRFRFALQNQLHCRRRHRKNARQHFSNDLILLNQINRRHLLLTKSNQQNGGGCPTIFTPNHNNNNAIKSISNPYRIRYPISCPLARKHGVNVPFISTPSPNGLHAAEKHSLLQSPIRPDSLSVSSVYPSQNGGKSPSNNNKISQHSSPCSRILTPNNNNTNDSGIRSHLDVGICGNRSLRRAKNLLEQAHSDCYNVFFDGDKLVISFVSDQSLKPGNSI